MLTMAAEKRRRCSVDYHFTGGLPGFRSLPRSGRLGPGCYLHALKNSVTYTNPFRYLLAQTPKDSISAYYVYNNTISIKALT